MDSVPEIVPDRPEEINSSIAAGGIYDNMISGFLESDQICPAIGISFGLDTIFDAIKAKTIESEIKRTVSKVYIIPLGEEARRKAFELTLELRKQGISSDMDFNSRKLGKNMEYASSYGVPFVIIIGDDELKNNEYMLRNMDSGDQKAIKLDLVKSLFISSHFSNELLWPL